MRTISLSEAIAHLRRYGELCRQETVVVTIQGKPAFQLVPVEDDENDDDFMDQLIATNQEFRDLLQSRTNEPTMNAEEVLRRWK